VYKKSTNNKMSAKIEELYKSFGILADAGEKAGEHTDAYQTILNANKGTSPEKKLACQFIPRFFKYFPTLAEAAIDAQLDLCEDEETPIRRQAIKSLPDFCVTSTEHIPRITDILTQLLQQEDATELIIVRSGLEKLIAKEPESALGGIFIQISVGDDLVREKAISFLTHATTHGAETLMKDEKVGQALLQEVKKALSDVTAEEFTSFISMLTKVKTVASNPQNLADLIAEQAELEKNFQPSEPESLNRLLTCARQATPFFLKGASSIKYLEYVFSKVLPVLKEITTEGADYKYEVLKLLADLSVYVSDESAKQYIGDIHKLLLEYMPLPSTEVAQQNDEEILKHLNFSYVECLMYTLHKFGRKHGGFFAAEESAELLKDFRQRLTYFGRMTQLYIKQLRNTLQNKAKKELEEKENKIKTMALKTCNNVNVLVKDLLHNPPSYKSNMAVSWKSKESPIIVSDESVEEKRKRAGITPISVDDLTPAKKERPMKTPGSGGAKKSFYSGPSEKKGLKMDDDYVGRSKQQYNNRGGGRNNRNRGRNNSSWNRGRGGRQNYQSAESHDNFLFR